MHSEALQRPGPGFLSMPTGEQISEALGQHCMTRYSAPLRYEIFWRHALPLPAH